MCTWEGGREKAREQTTNSMLLACGNKSSNYMILLFSGIGHETVTFQASKELGESDLWHNK